MRSAIVPCGTTSSLILPRRNSSSNSGGVGRGKLQISFDTCPVPNSLGSIGDPDPALFDTTVKSRAPELMTPSSSSCGWPTKPNPPSRMTDPSFRSAKASPTLPTRLSIIDPKMPAFQLLVAAFWPAYLGTTREQNCDTDGLAASITRLMTARPHSYVDPLDAAFSTPSRTEPAAEPAYLKGLNPEQREAVMALDGPVLVLAGAGTGKTRVLTPRLAHLLATRRAWPSQILAVTFTNKAAREMKERIGSLIGGAGEGRQWLGTFHSIGARMLRRHAAL